MLTPSTERSRLPSDDEWSAVYEGLQHHGEHARAAAKQIARAVTSDPDACWAASADAEGPVDVVDLFSGCGGMSAGFRLVNGLVPAYRLAAAADHDPVANKTYERNFGLVPDGIDVSDLAREPDRLRTMGRGLRQSHPLVLVGCAPCQGFSSHRNKAGEDDARNSLFGHVVTIAERLLPEVVIAENVPELVTARYWPYLADARDRLTRAGYHIHVAVHNSAEHGVPQERFRMLLLAMRHPFEPLRGLVERARFRTVRDAIGHLPAICAGERIKADPWHYTATHRESTIEVLRAVPHDGGSRPMHVGPDCLRRANDRQGKPAYEDVYGRLAWNRPAVTITNYARNPASGRYGHPEQDRGLSIREGACLQGFPRAFEFEGTLDPCFRQLGNSVPPLFAASLAAHLLGEIVGPPAAGTTAGIVKSVGPSFSRLIPALKRESRDLHSL